MHTAIGIKGEPDVKQKRCFDCAHCKGAISWWCTNKEAIEYRGSRIPGIRECNFWSAMKTSSLPKWVLNLNYIVIDLSIKEEQ